MKTYNMTMTGSGYAMPTVARMSKHQTQRILDEISQRIAVLERDGWDMTDTYYNIRDVSDCLIADEMGMAG